MSLDFAIRESEEPLEDDEAGAIYVSSLETGSSVKAKPSAKVSQLVREVEVLWPQPAPAHEDE